MNLQSIQRMYKPPGVVEFNPLDNMSKVRMLKMTERRDAIIKMLDDGEMFIHEIYIALSISDRTAYDDIRALVSQGKVRTYKKVFPSIGTAHKTGKSTTRTVIKLL